MNLNLFKIYCYYIIKKEWVLMFSFYQKLSPLFMIFIFKISIIACILGCSPSKQEMLGPKEIIAIDSHHYTRIFITYKDLNGQIYNESIHHSNKFIGSDIIINPHDFLALYGGSFPFGPFDAEKYSEYKKNKDQQ